MKRLIPAPKTTIFYGAIVFLIAISTLFRFQQNPNEENFYLYGVVENTGTESEISENSDSGSIPESFPAEEVPEIPSPTEEAGEENGEDQEIDDQQSSSGLGLCEASSTCRDDVSDAIAKEPDTQPDNQQPNNPDLIPDIEKRDFDQIDFTTLAAPTDIQLTAVTTEADQTVKLNKYFANAFAVDWGDSSPVEDMTTTITKTYATPGTYVITLSLTGGATRWTFNYYNYDPLVSKAGTTASDIYISAMPELSLFGDSATSVGTSFFGRFNENGALTSLPDGSFDTSNIISAGGNFFHNFNQQGALTSLPAGSFNTSNITTAATHFFYGFNQQGALTSLPDGSFDTSNIITAEVGFFYSFNQQGALTSLPDGSFNTSNITGAVGNGFFNSFNREGALTSLPVGSFDINNITTAKGGFFNLFNANGALTSLPDGSFNTSNITTTTGSHFFVGFNQSGALISLPDESFNTSNITSVDNGFFSSFNQRGALTSLPDGSFDISNITTVGIGFFDNFNQNGALTSLPDSSFNITNITGTVRDSFFNSFNNQGALTSLPDGSFDTSNITTAGNVFFTNFNQKGALTSLPAGSFNTSNISGTVGQNFFASFNNQGALTSLPVGSFDTTNIITAGQSFFYSFNSNGGLTSLPDGSFDTSNITTAEGGFFYSFNQKGALTSLPAGSFDTTNIITAGQSFFYYFNQNGEITSLPTTFKRPNVQEILDGTNNFSYAFNSSSSTLNRNASNIINGSNYPATKRNTFSNNQPGLCNINDNWKVTNGTCTASMDEIQLTVITTGASQTVTVNKYFANKFTVNWGDSSSAEEVTTGITKTYTTPGTYVITLSFTGGATRWTFTSNPLVPMIPKAETTASNVYISAMPDLSLFGTSTTNVGDSFFSYFNYQGALTSLPVGSFNTNNITIVGRHFFSNFNNQGALSSLPAASFNTSNITTVGDYFFSMFNNGGGLTSLPNGSFNTSNITTIGRDFFARFNANGTLTSLSTGSFNISNITTVGNNFFHMFNVNGTLTSLPTGSFDTSSITTAGSYFFASFNYNGRLTSLPAGSFDTSKITTVGINFFHDFNAHGTLTSLPTGSFDTSSITTVGDYFFSVFNYQGGLTSLPAGSFDTSQITTAGNFFFYNFNSNGKITDLPTSFKRPNIQEILDETSNFSHAFYSQYTLNRNASDIINGSNYPATNRGTFSRNQPGVCAVHENWSLLATCTPPTLTLNGSGEIRLEIYSPYIEQGVKRTDTGDGNGTLTVANSGTVNTGVLGDYLLEYRKVNSSGLTGTTSRIVHVVDTTAPTGTVTYNPTTGTRTSGSVIITLTMTEAITATPSGWATSGTNIYTRTYTANGSETVNFADTTGNTGSVNVNVPNIDKTAPTINNIALNPTAPTNGSVAVTVTATDTGAGLNATAYSFDNGNTRQATDNKTFTGNDTITIKVRDVVGNISSTGIVIDKIDIQAPVVTLNGSGEITLLLNGSYTEEGADWTDNLDETGTISNPTSGMLNVNQIGIYIMEYFYTDRAGNTGNTVTRTIHVLDPDGDEDGDGYTNEEEINNGTDPLDNSSHPAPLPPLPSLPPLSPITNNGGGGGRHLQKDFCPNGDFSSSYYDRSCGIPSSGEEIDDSDVNEHYSADEIYGRAKEVGLTTMPTFDQARMSDAITRAEMTKIIVKYVTTPLPKGGSGEAAGGFADVDINTKFPLPPFTKGGGENCSTFSDLNQTNEELQSYIIQACELGLMGLNADGRTPKEQFNPNDTITLAEVATIVSRLLRGEKYRGSEEWRYHSHLLALQKADIIPRNIDPMEQEPRGNVLLILMNSSTLLHQ